MATNRTRSSNGVDGSRASSRTRSLKSSQLSSRLMNRLGSGGAASAATVAVMAPLGEIVWDMRTQPLGPASAEGEPSGGAVGALVELPQHAEIDDVEVFALLGPLGRLEDH